MSDRKKLFAGLFIVLAVILVSWWLISYPKNVRRFPVDNPSPMSLTKAAPSPQESPAIIPPSAPIEERRKMVERGVLAMLATPITFYGKVIDQNKNPVSGALVNYGATDKYEASGSQYQGRSDANGNFSISGIKGAVLGVGVQKEGYYMIDEKSYGSFAYGLAPDSNSKEPPTKQNPAVFVLQKMGMTEPLIQVSSRQIDIPKEGRLFKINLATGKTGEEGLEVQSWIGNFNQKPFDWRFRLSISGGGLIERKSQFAFEAPEQGYQPAIDIDMPASTEKWSLRVTKDFFAKLPDGKYARFSIRFFPGERNFVVLESYVNPKAESRNLEFDPKKVAAP